MAGSTIWTIKKLLLWTTHYFQEHHLDSPRLDAELLLAHVLHKQRIYLYTDFDLIVEPSELSVYREYIKKRVSGVSTAAIIGEKEFMGPPRKGPVHFYDTGSPFPARFPYPAGE